jgi:MscS family membrane protein
MFHSHPRIDSDTIRVRFVGYGASSLNIDIRVYAKTREWNDFYAIKEDVLLRISDIVKESGTGFAFPSQTIYMTKDDGLDAGLAEKASKSIADWRRRRELPFPRFSDKKVEQMRDKLKYPPPGSPDYLASDEELSEGGEQLSSGPIEVNEVPPHQDEAPQSPEEQPAPKKEG